MVSEIMRKQLICDISLTVTLGERKKENKKTKETEMCHLSPLEDTSCRILPLPLQPRSREDRKGCMVI